MNGKDRRTGLRLRLTLAGLAAVAAAVQAGPAAAVTFARCTGALGQAGVQCGTVSVPVDRTGATAGTISLHVERVPARGFPSQPPLVALAGGPGQGASAFTRTFAALFHPALASRDLLVVDQRGTGHSGALRCSSLEGGIASEAELAQGLQACVTSLGSQVGHYRTADSTDDLDAVRAAVGAERLALFGVSYGTKVALAYASRYPSRVDRLVLDSVVQPDGPDVLWRSTFAAVPRVLREVCGRDCRFTGSPGADVAALTSRLAAGPLRAPFVAPNGRRFPAAISGPDLFGLLLAGDFDPWLRAALPAAISSAAKGDGAQLVRLLGDAGGSAPDPAEVFSTPLYFATTCSDSALPWGPAETTEQRLEALRAQVAAVPADAFAPFDRDSALQVSIPWTCRYWAAPTGRSPSFAGLPDVPALLLNGTLDLRTPLADAQAVAARLPRSRLIAVGGTGHSVLTSGPLCARNSAVSFLAGRAVPDARCAFPPVLLPERPAPRSLRAVGGRARARLAAAARLTLDDVVRHLPSAAGRVTRRSFDLRGGGLRGGRFVARPGRLVLDRVVFVPGVTVSGTIRGAVDPDLALVDRPRGTLVVRGGGRTVRVRIAAPVLG